MTNIDLSKQYWKYVDDVLNERIVTGKYIKLACKRMLDWSKRDDIFFDADGIDRKIRFVSKLHLDDGSPFVLLPYQQWLVANIFGWYYVEEPETRVVTNVLLLTARKSGKSTFAAALTLIAILCDGEPSPEVAFVANSAKQAGMLFKYCSNLCETIDPKGMLFHRTRHDIRIPHVKGIINVLSADAPKHAGRRDHMFIQDEGFAAKSDSLWDFLKTGQVQRRRPLAISISTAGPNIGSTYPLYAQWKNCCNILNSSIEDDSWFAAIYQLDDDDDWKDERVWIKANPSLGYTVTLRNLKELINTAINMPSKEADIRMLNLNQWVQSANVWLSYDTLMKCAGEVNLEDYMNEEAFGGIDLSISDDLSAIAVCIPPNEDRELNPDKYIFKAWLYVPGTCIKRTINRERFEEWMRKGWAIKTSGNVVDTDRILADQLRQSEILDFIEIGYDRYNANQYAINAETENLPMVQYSQTRGSFNEPTKLFESLIYSGKCIIDLNPAVLWCFGNVEISEDHNFNQKPVKADGDRTKKIDPVIAILEALGCYIHSSDTQPGAFIIQ